MNVKNLYGILFLYFLIVDGRSEATVEVRCVYPWRSSKATEEQTIEPSEPLFVDLV